MSWVYAFDLFGTLVFAISGVLTAVEKKFDLVGAAIIGFVTALGGGTIRDLLLGRTPVGWLKDIHYLLVILVAVLLCFLFRVHIQKLRKSMFFFDSLGIGLFSIMGTQIGLSFGISTPYAILLGIVSAVFGGVLRDVLTNEIPLIFRKEIYATACLAGAVCYVGLGYISPFEQIHMIVSMGLVFLIRYLSVRHDWSLPFKTIH